MKLNHWGDRSREDLLSRSVQDHDLPDVSMRGIGFWRKQLPCRSRFRPDDLTALVSYRDRTALLMGEEGADEAERQFYGCVQSVPTDKFINQFYPIYPIDRLKRLFPGVIPLRFDFSIIWYIPTVAFKNG